MTAQTNGLPPYIERGGEVVYSPPGVATGVRMYAFVLRSDTEHLAQMFDRYLNTPSAGAVAVEPAGPLVVLNFTQLARVGALTPPDVRRGYFQESEVAIWTLAYDTRREMYTTFVPYMIVDKGSAMAMGREVYGFPKQLGTVRMPSDDPPHGFALDVYGVTQWGPHEEFSPHKLLRVKRRSKEPDRGGSTLSSPLELVRALAEVVGADEGVLSVLAGGPSSAGAERVAKAVEMLGSGTLPMVFLKQIRDGRTPLKACYQAIQQADFVVTAFRGAGVLLGGYVLEMAELANEPIRRELGFPDGPLEPVASFWVDFDFTLAVAEELWRACTDLPTVTAAPTVK